MLTKMVIMNEISSNITPAAIASILGLRLKRARLNANLTQDQLAEKSGLSRGAVVNAEKGKAYLENFIALIQALGESESLDLFLPDQPISPIQLHKLKGKQRVRASSASSKESPEGVDW